LKLHFGLALFEHFKVLCVQQASLLSHVNGGLMRGDALINLLYCLLKSDKVGLRQRRG
jgi:hypothetical protein